MKKLTAITLLAVLSGSLGCTAATATGEGARDGAQSAGKADSTDEIVLGSYTNANSVDVGELARLELTAANEGESLPEGYDGRYSLTERTATGEKTSTGFYNAYRYAEKSWIRFLDEATNKTETTYEKYSWVYFDGTFVLRGDTSDSEFFMDLPLSGTDLRCTATRIYDDNVFEEGLSTDEYPDVSVVRNIARGTLKVGIGAAAYDAADEDDIAFAIEGETATATITQEGGDKIVVTGPANGSGAGRIVTIEGGRTKRVAALRCTGRTAAPPTVECTMRRLEGVDGPAAEITASLPLGSEDGVQSNDGIDAFEANYSFDISADSESLQVFFYENLHVQDETGNIGCDLAGVRPGARFCEDTVEIDKNLGTDSEDEETVHAFDFWCVIR